jgi:hypothetical protein
MCGCGRKRTQTVTTAQVQAEADARQAMATLEQQTISGAEQMLKSAANAASNARS